MCLERQRRFRLACRLSAIIWKCACSQAIPWRNQWRIQDFPREGTGWGCQPNILASVT